jgi:hypothetical protein
LCQFSGSLVIKNKGNQEQRYSRTKVFKNKGNQEQVRKGGLPPLVANKNAQRIEEPLKQTIIYTKSLTLPLVDKKLLQLK